MNLKAARLLTFSFTVAVIAILSGCAGYHPARSGILATQGCTIKADDDSFTIESGQEFQPPFQTAENKFILRSLANDQKDLVRLSDRALQTGAVRVRVTVPGVAKPLYGVLALFPISNSGEGPGSRSYRIVVPQEYVDAATGGNISVVYETYQVPGMNMPSWILWLSDSSI